MYIVIQKFERHLDLMKGCTFIVSGIFKAARIVADDLTYQDLAIVRSKRPEPVAPPKPDTRTPEEMFREIFSLAKSEGAPDPTPAPEKKKKSFAYSGDPVGKRLFLFAGRFGSTKMTFNNVFNICLFDTLEFAKPDPRRKHIAVFENSLTLSVPFDCHAAVVQPLNKVGIDYSSMVFLFEEDAAEPDVGSKSVEEEPSLYKVKTIPVLISFPVIWREKYLKKVEDLSTIEFEITTYRNYLIKRL